MAFPLIQLTEIELTTPNPNRFRDNLQWKMRVEVLDHLSEQITVSFVWVGSANSSAYDQLLDEFEIGPFPVGTTDFVLDCDGPQANLVPPNELLDVTVLNIVFSYKGQPFLKVGYYARVAYWDDSLNAMPPQVVNEELLGKSLVMSQPTVVNIPIVWGQDDAVAEY